MDKVALYEKDIPCFEQPRGCVLGDRDNEELCADRCVFLKMWDKGYEAKSAALSAERARVIEMCADFVRDWQRSPDFTPDGQSAVQRIEAALRALGQQDASDIAAATKALVDFDENGGVALGELKDALGQQDNGGTDAAD